jgi:hypothetical protein
MGSVSSDDRPNKPGEGRRACASAPPAGRRFRLPWTGSLRRFGFNVHSTYGSREAPATKKLSVRSGARNDGNMSAIGKKTAPHSGKTDFGLYHNFNRQAIILILSDSWLSDMMFRA